MTGNPEVTQLLPVCRHNRSISARSHGF